MPLLCALALLAPPLSAQDWIAQSIEKMGGRSRLLSVGQVKFTYVGHETLPEQSERPTGPLLNTYLRGENTLDFRALTISGKDIVSGLVYGEREFPRNVSSKATSFATARRLALGPERVLITASTARDLTLKADRLYQGTPHAVLTFHWGDVPVELLINRGTGMPTAVTTLRPLEGFWSMWGDVRETTTWGAWTLLPGGYFEPSQIVTDINGTVTSDTTVLRAEVSRTEATDVPIAPPAATPPATSRYVPRYAPKAVVPGIVQYAGPFNTTVVDLGKELVVIEPVLDSWFASAFLDRLQTDFPGKPVRAVIATDDAWPHFGGLRTFAARGARLVGLKINRPVVDRLLKAPYRTLPDEWGKHATRSRFLDVTGPTRLGDGPNQMLLLPIQGESSERMMMVYFPDHRLLYGTDLLQRQGTGFFFPAYPKELADAVERARLDVTTVFGEHLPPTPWSQVTDFVHQSFTK